jgi:hypothetical protein
MEEEVRKVGDAISHAAREWLKTNTNGYSYHMEDVPPEVLARAAIEALRVPGPR